MVMGSYYTYMYTDNHDQPFYVGKGKGRRTELRIHNHGYVGNKIKNIGKDNVKTVILVDDISEKLAFFYEAFYIKLYGRKNNGTGILCNLTHGGEGSSGYKHTPEARAKLSAIAKRRKLSPQTKRKIGLASRGNQYAKGMKHSEETKQRISNTNKQTVFTEEHRHRLSVAAREMWKRRKTESW